VDTRSTDAEAEYVVGDSGARVVLSAGSPLPDGQPYAVPDPVMGEEVGAVVVPAPGAEFDVGAFLAAARERLADFKVPQHVAVRRELLPRDPGGKVLKPQLRTGTDWGDPLR
jgi:non-ribosomal peptide synthetase component E (peptide arylation enzyme)